MKKITLRIRTGKLKEAKGTKRYPIRYGKPIVIVNPDVAEKLAEQMKEERGNEEAKDKAYNR